MVAVTIEPPRRRALSSASEREAAKREEEKANPTSYGVVVMKENTFRSRRRHSSRLARPRRPESLFFSHCLPM